MLTRWEGPERTYKGTGCWLGGSGVIRATDTDGAALHAATVCLNYLALSNFISKESLKSAEYGHGQKADEQICRCRNRQRCN